LIDVTQSLVFSAVITTEFFESIIFNAALEIARENNYPCFFIIENDSRLPDNWHTGLNIEFLEYYNSKEQLNTLSLLMSNEIQNYHKSINK